MEHLIVIFIVILCFSPILLGILFNKFENINREKKKNVGKEIIIVRYDDYNNDKLYVQETKVKVKKGDRITVTWPYASFYKGAYKATVVKDNHIIEEGENKNYPNIIHPINILYINGNKVKNSINIFENDQKDFFNDKRVCKNCSYFIPNKVNEQTGICKFKRYKEAFNGANYQIKDSYTNTCSYFQSVEEKYALNMQPIIQNNYNNKANLSDEETYEIAKSLFDKYHSKIKRMRKHIFLEIIYEFKQEYNIDIPLLYKDISNIIKIYNDLQKKRDKKIEIIIGFIFWFIIFILFFLYKN